MAVISISLNEVLRGFTDQFIYTYNKYIESTELNESDITSFNLLEFFKFTSLDELNRFLYLEHPLEICGHADQLTDGLINLFNVFLDEMADENQHEIQLVSKEANKSIPATFFFLSKTGCRADKIRFVKQSVKEWDGTDVLITANPDALLNKPSGKISVKIKAPYNADAPADYELDSIIDFIKDRGMRNKILNTKIITYEQI